MNATKYRDLHRTARLGNLGTLTLTAGNDFYWFLENVYDIRFPHVGSNRHCLPETFDTLRGGTVRQHKLRRALEYQREVTLCPHCKGYHHRRRDCPRHDGY